MTDQQLESIKYMIANWKPSMMISKCHQRGVTKWQLIEYLKVPLYMAKPYIGDPLYIVDVRGCRLCGLEFDIRYTEGHYITRKKCSCADDGTKANTLDKIKVYLAEDKAQIAIQNHNQSKTKGLTTTTRSWIAKGHTEEESKELVRQEQARRSAKSPAAQKGATDFSIRSTGYWITKHGMTEEEAKEAVRLSQVKNGLEWHIAQYGDIEGPVKYAARMDSWNAKMAEKVKTGVSSVASSLFDQIDQIASISSVREKVIRTDDRLYRVDFYHDNKVIEFFGDYWHANPKIYQPNRIMVGGKLAEDIQSNNDRKIRALRNKGIEVLVVWEHDYKMNKQAEIDKCLAFLKKIIMKIDINYGELFAYLEEYLDTNFQSNEEVDVSQLGIRVPTPTGDALVHWVIRKDQLPTIKFEFNNGTTLECATKHILVDSNGEDCYADSLKVGDQIMSNNGVVTVVNVNDAGYQDCYDIGIPAPHRYYDAQGILHHNTIICGALSKICEQYGRTLIIVPSKSLVTQTEEDYRNLGLDVGVYYGDRKEIGHQHTISTWQSLSSLGKKSGFDEDFTIADMIEGVVTVIVDEAHSAKGNDLQAMLTGPLAHIPIRWGLTGTIPKDEVDQIRLLSCLGPVVGNITAKELQDKGVLSQCHVHIQQLDDEHVEFKSYADEKNYLTSDTARLKWIADKAKELALEGNTLILIDRIETGDTLHSLIADSVFINGSVKNAARKEEYDSIQEANNKILIATYGVAAVGINIPRIFNLILIEPGKSFVRVIQSIGRGIRKAKDKDFVDIWDVTSTLKFSSKHLKARKTFYDDAAYPHTTEKINYRKK